MFKKVGGWELGLGLEPDSLFNYAAPLMNGKQTKHDDRSNPSDVYFPRQSSDSALQTRDGRRASWKLPDGRL